VSRYQKGETNLDFTEARDSEWQWHQLGRMQMCTSHQTDNHASTPPLSFLQAGCPSCHPTNSVKALKAHTHTHPFNVPSSVTTWVGRYQKGKTNLDFTETRDSEWQWQPLGHMQVRISLQSDNHASTPIRKSHVHTALLTSIAVSFSLSASNCHGPIIFAAF